VPGSSVSDLHEILQAREIDTLVIIGTATTGHRSHLEKEHECHDL